LREHHEDYDASYQQMDMEEEEHVEHEYREQQRKRIQELCEKTKSTMRRALYWEENDWPELTCISQYEAWLAFTDYGCGFFLKHRNLIRKSTVNLRP
jgi:hypothetical protein